MKVADLEGLALDYWVSRAERRFDVKVDGDRCVTYRSGGLPRTYAPSKEWMKGGPLIERESITVMCFTEGWAAQIGATTYIDTNWDEECWRGPSPLIAAMRCLVASRFGEEVPDVEYQNIIYPTSTATDPEVKKAQDAALERSMRKL